eukprot:2908296-Amphidinium_carterae.1
MELLPFRTRVDACAYGFQHKGEPCKKPWLIRSSVSLPGLERLCTCSVPHIACEGGTHVAKSSRYTPQMVRFAIRALRKSMGKLSVSACASDTDTESDSDSVE